MWVMAFFDLPTDTAEGRRNYTRFRNSLLDDGFLMLQSSMYTRSCPSMENAQVHINRVKKRLPPHGSVGIFRITDRQYEMLELFVGKQPNEKPQAGGQLLMF